MTHLSRWDLSGLDHLHERLQLILQFTELHMEYIQKQADQLLFYSVATALIAFSKLIYTCVLVAFL